MSLGVFRTLAGAAAVSLLFMLPASAAIIEIGVHTGEGVDVTTLNSANVGDTTSTGPTSFQWVGSQSNGAWSLEWDLEISTNPSVTGVATFINMMGTTQSFSFDVTEISSEAFANPTVNGASTISVLDRDDPGDGATMAALSGDSIYRAFIEATTEDTLYDDPYSLVAPSQSQNNDARTWGPQAANTAALSVGDQFGINHDFSLTAGDQATINSSFFVVPEPASALLVMFGAVALVRYRR